MMKILLLNRKNTDNLGDIAINHSMKKMIDSLGYECIDEDFSNPNESGLNKTTLKDPPKRTINLRGSLLDIIRHIPILYCYVWYFQNRRLFKVLDKQPIDAVVIGGGELVQSNLIFPIALYWWTKLIHSHGIDKCYLFAVGVTKEWGVYQRILVNKSLNYIKDIFVRDTESMLNMQVIFGRPCNLVPDSVFVNSINKRGKGEYSLYGITDFRRIKKHSTLFRDKKAYYEYSIKSIADIETETQKEVILFYTTKADLNECREFNNYCKEKRNIIYKIANISVLEDLKTYISEAAVIASPRMHACILGKLYSVDVRPILISNKMKSFAELYKDFGYEASLSYQKELLGALATILSN